MPVRVREVKVWETDIQSASYAEVASVTVRSGNC